MTSPNQTEITNEFQLAVDLVNQTSRNIFLTGKAGTGKTTFLRHIRATTLKQMAVVAPTGVAAINAGGSTIHSLFQLPFSPFIPDGQGNGEGSNNKHSLISRLKYNSERIKMLQQLELLVIDEISMVRCDVLDAIDLVLKHYRHRYHEPFGGVQLLLIGDLYQLSPVAVNEEWQLLSRFYSSPYFFDSRVMQQSPPVKIEFTKIYRQNDHHFIHILNEVRNNAVSPETRLELEKLHQPGFRLQKDDGYIVLTTHNNKADAINREELQKLPGNISRFSAKVEGEFSEKAYPADETLELKEGARVMFIRNDREKKYFNGKIGTVTEISRDRICVRCKDETEEIEVKQETWEQVRYVLNSTSNQLEENVAGSFTQYPLRLAWAITIHKSQGLSFEKAVIDAGSSFAPGQVYVALSRCTTLEGVVLLSRITPSSLKVDDTVVHFSNQDTGADTLATELMESKKAFQHKLLTDLFDFQTELRLQHLLQLQVEKNAGDYNNPATDWMSELAQLISVTADIAAKFRRELQQLQTTGHIPEENELLQQRLKDASVYFVTQLQKITGHISNCPAETDSRSLAKQFNDHLKNLNLSVALKLHQVKGLADGFKVDSFYRHRKRFVTPSMRVNAWAAGNVTAAASEHAELVSELKQLRNAICARTGLAVYMVASTSTLEEIATKLPRNEKQLMLIKGFGKAKVQKYGTGFLDIINGYCEAYNIAPGFDTDTDEDDEIPAARTPRSKQLKTPPAAKKKGTTTEQSYEMFRTGLSMEEIAKERNLALSTIESHLTGYVKIGAIPAEDLVDPVKLALIKTVLADYEPGAPLSPLMEKLDNQVSYGELRLAAAGYEWEQKQLAPSLVKEESPLPGAE